MRLGGARRPAAAIASCLAAEQQDNIARTRRFPPDVLRGRRADHRADLHALGYEPFVIDFVYQPCRKPDLVAVGAVSRSGRGDDFSLRELARQRLAIRRARVGRAAEPHRLIDKRAAGERVAYRAADAGCRPAKGFNLGRVVVRFVLEEHEPVLRLAVHRNLGFHRAGVDLVGNIQPLQFSLFSEPLCPDRRHVHQRHGLSNTELFAQGEIGFICLLRARVVEFHVVQRGQKRRMPAVIRPIGVEQFQLRQRRVAPFGLKIALAAEQITQVHRKPVLRNQIAKA
ncbi:hypothetical protein SDC9_118907 [bioreactor metagenome]|uniref:Uncharacterized protein n=1 Tax=bioreactor metagenome TaxID=1076179 RepID=A0A645C325_9ZZZZ